MGRQRGLHTGTAVGIRKMIADRYEVDPKYFIDKYGVPIIGKKTVQDTSTQLAHPFSTEPG